MNEQRKELLRKKFPNLYAGGVLPSCGDGWFDIIYDLSTQLERYLLTLPEEERKEQFASQIKEKFGTLRFYMNKPGDPRCEELIRPAERQTQAVCEDTGVPGKQRNVIGWLKTLSAQAFINRIVSYRNRELGWALKRLVDVSRDGYGGYRPTVEAHELEWARRTIKRWEEIDEQMKKFAEEEGLVYY